ncbi:MAG: hypothetical protein HQ536_01110, partial [Parcubacteria group bacterium]|nr:hypothetical protein [Parcubacteria group bacterium]
MLESNWEEINKKQYKKDEKNYIYKKINTLTNPDIWKIMQHCRDNDVVPNITVKGDDINKLNAVKLSYLCGAVAVSLYGKKTTYDAVARLMEERKNVGTTIRQVNIHALLSEETYDRCFELMEDMKTDKRLSGLNAVVFLWLKKKGKRNDLHLLPFNKYKKLVSYAFKNEIRIGFDSCSAPMFLKAIRHRKNYERLKMMVEPCESTCFSFYLNVEGKGYPCSFAEGEKGWKGIDVLKC